MVGFGLMVAGVTAAWILVDDTLQSFHDAPHHHLLSLQVSRALRQDGLTGAWQVLQSGHVAWPPGLFALHGLGAYLVSEGFHAMRLANLLYLPLLMGAVHALGRRWGDPRTAALATVLTVSTVGVAFHLRHICIDNPATVLVTLSMLALTLVARVGRPWTWSLFGALCGLGLLFRVQVLFFLAAPAAALAAWHLWRAGSTRARLGLLGWMALGAAAALLISSPYWASRPRLFFAVALSHLGIYLPVQGLVHEQGPGHQLGLGDGMVYYALAMGRLVGWPLVLVILGTLPRLLRRRPQVVLLLLCVAGSFLAHAATISREPRYLLPTVPVLVLLAALGLEQLSRRARVILTVLVLLGTTGPMLFLAGNRWRLEGTAMSWLFHGEYTRSATPSRQPQVSEALGTALAKRIARKPPVEANMLLFTRSLADENIELKVHLARWLPRVDLFVPHERLHDIPFMAWKDSHKLSTNYYLVSSGTTFDLPPLWEGTLASKKLLLYEVAHHNLEWVVMSQVKTVTPQPAKRKKP